MKVQDVMTSEVKSCRLETSLAAAAVMMLDYDCGALTVVNDENKVIITPLIFSCGHPRNRNNRRRNQRRSDGLSRDQSRLKPLP